MRKTETLKGMIFKQYVGAKKENQYSCHKGPVAICFGFRSSTATWDAGPTEHMGTVGTSKK